MTTRATYQFKYPKATHTYYINEHGHLAGAARYFKKALEFCADTSRKYSVIPNRDLRNSFVFANDVMITDSHERHYNTEYRYNVEPRNGEYHIEAYKRVSHSSEEFECAYKGNLEDFISLVLLERAA